MKQYVTSFNLRWSDLDPNRHLANTSFIALMNDTRIRFLKDQGLGQPQFEALQLGPIILTEQVSYFKEVLDGKVYGDLELRGMSEDAVFFEFDQHLYNEAGLICAHLRLQAAWLDLATRKLTEPPELVKAAIEAIPKSAQFKTIAKGDIRRPDPALLQRKLDLDQASQL